MASARQLSKVLRAAYYTFRLEAWRWVYVSTAMFALYLNVFCVLFKASISCRSCIHGRRRHRSSVCYCTALGACGFRSPRFRCRAQISSGHREAISRNAVDAVASCFKSTALLDGPVLASYQSRGRAIVPHELHTFREMDILGMLCHAISLRSSIVVTNSDPRAARSRPSGVRSLALN
jgi:hypothetical protein